jgi:phage FluMu protein Com
MAKNLRSCVRCGAPIGKTLAKLSKRPTQCPSCRAVNYVKTIDGDPTGGYRTYHDQKPQATR